MWQLNAEQVQRLQQIQRERDLRRLAELLAQHFPDIPGRLGERYAALIAHAVPVGAARGLTHLLCLARYLACWFMLGAEFETRPGFEWAQDILADPRRPQGAKVFQLCRRTSEVLVRLGQQVPPVPLPMKAADFDRAIAALDAELSDAGLFGTLVRGGRIALGQPCDIDAVDLRPAGPGAAQPYTFEQGQWRRAAVSTPGGAVTLAAGNGASTRAAPSAAGAEDAARPAALPARLTLLSRPPGAEPARLRLRTRTAHCCDAQVHPLVTLNGPQGVAEWRGPLAADVALPLYAQVTAPPPAGAWEPAIAADTPVQISLLSLSSCGLRESGAALGELSTQIATYAAEQHLMVWRREPLPELTWPEVADLPASALPRCRIERDGQPLDAARWQAGLQALDRQLAQGLSRLFTSWQRESGVSQPRMVAEPAVLAGEAGLAWGWVDGPQGLASPPLMRLAGRLDLLACQLSLRLGGQLALHGAVSRLSLQSHGRADLQASWQRGPADAAPWPETISTQAQFRHPFVLQAEALVQPEPALLGFGPVTGALVGHCGLRARADGVGLQWFAKLDVEPVNVTVHALDPLLGQQDRLLPLLPAVELLDWSIG